jgi:carnosine N-methyltransferase
LKIISAFRQYEAYSITANNKRRRDFFKLPEEDRKLLEALGWKARLDKVDECIAVNAGVLRAFVENPEIFMDEEDMMYADDGQSNPEHSRRPTGEISAGEYGEDVHMDHGNSHDHSHNHSHSHPILTLTRIYMVDSQRRTTPVSATDMEKIRSTLKQLVRDWSEDVSCPIFA